MTLDDICLVMLSLGLETSCVACAKHMQWYHDHSGSAVACAGRKSCLHSRVILVQTNWHSRTPHSRMQSMPVLWTLTAAGLLLRSAEIDVPVLRSVQILGKQGFFGVGCSHWFCFLTCQTVNLTPLQKLVFHQRTGRSLGTGWLFISIITGAMVPWQKQCFSQGKLVHAEEFFFFFCEILQEIGSREL